MLRGIWRDRFNMLEINIGIDDPLSQINAASKLIISGIVNDDKVILEGAFVNMRRAAEELGSDHFNFVILVREMAILTGKSLKVSNEQEEYEQSI